MVNNQQYTIGILSRFYPEKEKPIGMQTTFISECINAAESLNVKMIVFDPIDLSGITEDACSGYTLDNNKWVKEIINIPYIIYDRYYSSIVGFESSIESAKEWLINERGCHFINPITFAHIVTDKLEFTKKISEYSIDVPSIVLKNIKTDKLGKCLQKYRKVIVKPRFGWMGRGIIRISGTDGKYFLMEKNNRLICTNISEVIGFIKHIGSEQGMKLKDFIVQEMISIPGQRKRFFDLRILMQRIDDKTPEIVGEVARVSVDNMTVPNLDKGGLAMDSGKWLDYVFGSKKSENVQQAVRSMARQTYSKMEEMSGIIGEMGIDIIIDNCGRPWVLEINSKPGRWAFQRLGYGFGLSKEKKEMYLSIRRKSIENIIQFGKWIQDAGKQ